MLRLYAGLLVALIIYALFVAVLAVLNPPALILKILGVVGLVACVLAVLSISSHYFITHELKNGATPGKKLVGLRVVSLDGAKLTFKQCLYRDLLRLVDATLIVPGLLSILLNKQNRRLGDLATGTMVIYLEKDAKESQYFYIKQQEYHLLTEKLEPKKPDLEMINNFLRFAFPHFIKGVENKVEAGKWIETVRTYFKTELGTKIDRETALLYFAELCHQTKFEMKHSETVGNLNSMELKGEKNGDAATL
jgi:uncharacterized RDD family membrane protein YckC